MTCIKIILANLIFIFHLAIILFVIIAPFSGMPSILILHIVFGLSLLLHWKLNSDVCSLSVFESGLRGVNYKETFTHKFIAPVYNVSNTSASNICWTSVIILICISFINLAQTNQFKNFLNTRDLRALLAQ